MPNSKLIEWYPCESRPETPFSAQSWVSHSNLVCNRTLYNEEIVGTFFRDRGYAASIAAVPLRKVVCVAFGSSDCVFVPGAAAIPNAIGCGGWLSFSGST